jgi:hypothetical protein
MGGWVGGGGAGSGPVGVVAADAADAAGHRQRLVVASPDAHLVVGPSARHACIETLRVGGIKWRDARGTMRQCSTLNARFENDSLAGMHTTSIHWLNR